MLHSSWKVLDFRLVALWRGRTDVQARDGYITKFSQLWSSTIISVEDITIVKKQDGKFKGVLV